MQNVELYIVDTLTTFLGEISNGYVYMGSLLQHARLE